MRRSVLILLVLALLAAGSVGAWAWLQVRPPAGGPFTVVIPENCDAATAGTVLQQAGAITSADAFGFILQRRPTLIQPGRYVFAHGVYPWVAARILAKGPPPEPEVTATIPEGKRLPEIATLLEAAGVCDAVEFLARARDPLLVRELLGIDAPNLEGYLFPNTYRFRPNSNADAVVRRLFAHFIETLGTLERPGLSRHQFVTLASIVEREAQVASERPIIAAVFLNRLQRNMRLEADPTVRFALDRWDTAPVLYADLENESPYNTYRVFGLPPGPIASVSRASLEAVAHPAETDVLFFVARGDGSHAFAATFPEHQRNIATFR